MWYLKVTRVCDIWAMGSKKAAMKCCCKGEIQDCTNESLGVCNENLGVQTLGYNEHLRAMTQSTMIYSQIILGCFHCVDPYYVIACKPFFIVF